jgi:hypothetical protein
VIGPNLAGEPTQFVAGRKLVIAPNAGTNLQVAPCVVDSQRNVLVVDLCNSLAWPILATVPPPYACVNPVQLEGDGFTVQATLGGAQSISRAGWLQTAGIFEWALDETQMSAVAVDRVGIQAQSVGTPSQTTLILGEHPTGNYADIDARSARLDPGQSVALDVYAMHLGQPLAGQSLNFGLYQQDASAPLDSLGITPVPPPPLINSVPTTAISAANWPITVTTGSDGKATLTIQAQSGPIDLPVERQAVDSQVYFLGEPAGWQTWGAPGTAIGAECALSVLIFNVGPPVPNPTWADVRQILAPYAAIYPQMAALLAIDNEDTVTTFAPRLSSLLALPIDDPSHMPVTRDLSAYRRNLLLAYLRSLTSGT